MSTKGTSLKGKILDIHLLIIFIFLSILIELGGSWNVADLESEVFQPPSFPERVKPEERSLIPFVF